MSYEELKTALVKQRGLTPEAVSMRALRRQRKWAPMSKAQAYGLVAHEERLDITKYLPDSDVQVIRQIVHGQAAPDSPGSGSEGKATPKPTIIKIGPDFDLHDPLLPKRVLKDAVEMAYVYAKLYVFENSVREVIKQTMSKRHGPDWWSQFASKKLQDRASQLMKDEKRNAWHGRRGRHPIYYVYLSDLGNIVRSRWKEDFHGLFPSVNWVLTRINEVNQSRRIIAHTSPLRKQDRELIELYFVHWFDQIDDVKDELT
ncbi:MAG TPA: Swt1 family HEPN domain-containing protein [Anaerolineae bacterium]|nr:Swt1 family HEPN domain-containing protein [Anaerolineae bacterium]HUV94297.1 Swt1 family HEPN domain-containing protein [Anaerolineae bacterium]